MIAEQNINILMTSVGRRSYLVKYFKEALGSRGQIIGANSIPDTQGLLEADIQEIVPSCFEPGFLPSILDLCLKHQVKLLFSLHDLETVYLSRHRKEIMSTGAFPVIPDHEFTWTCFDKIATMEFAQRHGLAVPTTYKYLEDARLAVADGALVFPVIVKPRFGFGSIGLEAANSLAELDAAYLLVHAKIMQTPILHSLDFNPAESVLIQQMIIGQEYGVDVINDLDGQFAACLVERKLGMHGGETDAAIIEDRREIVELGEKIAALSHHPGNLDIDVIMKDGVPYLIDMNPRFGGHYPFAHMAGADVPAAIIAWASGKRPNSEWLTAKTGYRAYKDIVIKTM